jgi:uncharacterized protein YcbK (DUF882 family)
MKHFQISEFDSPDIPGSGESMNLLFLDLLDAIREDAKIPFIINSGFRTPSYNALKKVGGKPNSAHLKGLAADISAKTSSEKFKIVYSAIKFGVLRIGIGSNFIHLDNDLSLPHPVIWTY